MCVYSYGLNFTYSYICIVIDCYQLILVYSIFTSTGSRAPDASIQQNLYLLFYKYSNGYLHFSENRGRTREKEIVDRDEYRIDKKNNVHKIRFYVCMHVSVWVFFLLNCFTSFMSSRCCLFGCLQIVENHLRTENCIYTLWFGSEFFFFMCVCVCALANSIYKWWTNEIEKTKNVV